MPDYNRLQIDLTNKPQYVQSALATFAAMFENRSMPDAKAGIRAVFLIGFTLLDIALQLRKIVELLSTPKDAADKAETNE